MLSTQKTTSNACKYAFFRLFLFSMGLYFINIGLFSCKNNYEPSTKEDLGYNFFPLEIDTFTEYQVTETAYTPSAPPQTTSYQLREEITSAFIASDNRLAYRYERFRRNNENEAWVLDSAGMMQRTDYQALRSENNQIYMKMTFPLKENNAWNGNAYNTFNKNTYTLKNLRQPTKISDKYNFLSTLQIVQANDSSLVSLDKRIETYAENIGLVKRENKQITYCTIGNCIGQRIISFGRASERILINYGKKLP